MGIDEVEIAAVPSAKLRGACGVGVLVGVERVHEGALSVGLTVALQELLECFEGSTDLLLRHMRQRIDLAECAGNLGLSACDEDASSNNGILRLALEELGIIRHLEDMLGGILNGLGDVDSVAEMADFTISGKKSLGSFIVLFNQLISNANKVPSQLLRCDIPECGFGRDATLSSAYPRQNRCWSRAENHSIEG